MNEFTQLRSGFYKRYSDDILLVLPQDDPDYESVIDYASALISKFGDHIKIKKEKTAVVHFIKSGNEMLYEHCAGPQGKNGLEYLGFRFDGRDVYVRDSTVSRLHRKIALASRGSATKYVSQNNELSCDELLERFNVGRFLERFGRVSREQYSDEDYSSWTFWTYLRRASIIFGLRGRKIFKQVARMRLIIRQRIAREIVRASSRA